MSLVFRTRKIIKPEDLNSRGTLFGGRLLAWIDEECAIYSGCQMNTHSIVTKYMSELNFLSPAFQDDVVEIGVDTVKVGATSLTVRCVVRNKETRKDIVSVSQVVFVAVGENGRPTRHALSSVLSAA